MNWPAQIPLPSTIALGLATFALAGKLFWTDPEIVNRAEAATPEDTSALVEKTTQTVVQIDLAAYSETLERPLFDPTRRPRELATAAPVEAPIVDEDPVVPDASDIAIFGFMQTDGVLSAYLRSANQTIWVVEGEFFDGWKVVEIERGRVVLDQDGHRVEKRIYGRH